MSAFVLSRYGKPFPDDFRFKHEQKTLQTTKIKFDVIWRFFKIKLNQRLIFEKKKRPGLDLHSDPNSESQDFHARGYLFRI